MKSIRYRLPIVIAILFGWLTLLSLLFFPDLSSVILNWGMFLAAAALILGVLNLFVVHLARVRRNPYSIVLLLGMLIVFILAITDSLGFTDNYVTAVFRLIQAPLEAALASLLAFFLLFIGFRLFQRRRSVWSALFLITALFLLVSQSPLPSGWGDWLTPARDLVNTLFVNAGMRGILIGVALGTIVLSLRILVGLERPYNK